MSRDQSDKKFSEKEDYISPEVMLVCTSAAIVEY